MMDTIYQLWGLEPREADWDAFLRKLEYLQERRPAWALVCGAGAPDEVYRGIERLAGRGNSRLFLWLPVFSEWDDLAQYDPMIDWTGADFIAVLPDTGFRFRCPSSSLNRETFFSESLRHLKRAAFDGVFLDRIRFPSFQYGLSGILGCFCPKCSQIYMRNGLRKEDLTAACRALTCRAEQKESNPLGLEAFENFRWQLSDPSLQALLDARCQLITDAMKVICSRYRDLGYLIGLDLFSPALGYFAGQDFKALAPLADFIKPMLYLHTDAPAGLPYELKVMSESLGQDGTLQSLFGVRTAEEFAGQEITRMRALPAGTHVYCGMEYNRVDPIAPVGPDQILATLRLFRQAGVTGVMPSWSLLSAPEENLSVLMDGLSSCEG